MEHKHKNELGIPSYVQLNENAMELLRVWFADGKQTMCIKADVWNDPAAWGILLVDLAKNIAAAYEENSSRNYSEVLKRIKEGFDAEWFNPTN